MLSYLITDPNYYTSNPKSFSEIFSLHVKKHKPHMACLRDKITTNYDILALPFVAIANSLHVKPILHTDHLLASKLKAFGVHLPFSEKERIIEAKKLHLFVIVSTHTLDQALEVEHLGADAFTYSPIFDTPNKGKPVGLVKLKEIIDKISINCFALGGIITKEHIEKCSNVGAKGFASIRYFI